MHFLRPLVGTSTQLFEIPFLRISLFHKALGRGKGFKGIKKGEGGGGNLKGLNATRRFGLLLEVGEGVQKKLYTHLLQLKSQGIVKSLKKRFGRN